MARLAVTERADGDFLEKPFKKGDRFNFFFAKKKKLQKEVGKLAV